MTIHTDVQIQCVRREIAMRRAVYPRRVADNRMKQEAADREIASMEAVLQTLMMLKDQGGVLA